MTTAIDRAIAAIDEADIRAGVRALQENPGDVANMREGLAHKIGQDAIADLCDAFGLDSDELLAKTEARGAFQGDALLTALGIQANSELRTLVRGAVQAGLLTGVRIGLLIADERERESRSRSGR